MARRGGAATRRGEAGGGERRRRRRAAVARRVVPTAGCRPTCSSGAVRPGSARRRPPPRASRGEHRPLEVVRIGRILLPVSDPQQPSPPPNVSALVDAIDVRAKQAGAEGATEVMQRMLGSVSDVLAAISDRLDHVEDLLGSDERRGGGGAGGSGAVVEAVQAGLTSFNARLGRLEEAFVQAVDDSGSGTQSVVDEVRTVVTRALEEAVPAGKKAPALDPRPGTRWRASRPPLGVLADGAASGKPVEDALSLALAAVGERLDGLEQRLVSAVAGAGGAGRGEGRPVDARPLRAARSGHRPARLPRAADHGDGEGRASGTTIEDAFELVQVRIAGLESAGAHARQ